jgi:multisubunit Na+/H+ antiporter MnhE subunit
MIKRKVLFSFALVLWLGFMSLSMSGIGTSVEASAAVGQLSDDIVVNSASRSIIRSGSINAFVNIGLALGIVGMGFSLIPKNFYGEKKKR